MKSGKTIIGRIAEYQHYYGGPLENDPSILHLIDGVSYNRLTCSTTSIHVPALQDTTVEVKNISPRYLYTGSESEPILLQSRPHVQGEIFWGTVSTFHPKGTVLPNQERVQVPRHVRNTSKPQYSASKKVKATKHSNIVLYLVGLKLSGTKSTSILRQVQAY